MTPSHPRAPWPSLAPARKLRRAAGVLAFLLGAGSRLPAASMECYTNAVPTGLSLIANQLDTGGNTLNEIMPNLPEAVCLYKWVASQQRFFAAGYDQAAQSWRPSNFTLSPGEGAWIYNPGSQFNVIRCGTRRNPILPINPDPGFNLLSRQVPGTGTFDNITGLSPQEDYQVWKWLPGSQLFEFVIYIEGVGWVDNQFNIGELTAGPGESLFILLSPGGVPSPISPPTISGGPTNISTSLQTPATFTVIANGTPPLQFQWRLNGANIPGATNDTYHISDASLPDGGAYSVVLANAGGVCVSPSASLRFTDVSTVPGSNSFASATLISGGSGRLQASNVGATRELNEPPHGGKTGGSSLWYRWVAPSNGIATFTTSGSAFDTLLGIYTGTAVNNLTTIAGDDDRGGFFTSTANFNASSGVTYRIAVDGLRGAQGQYVLAWTLEPTPQSIPVITLPPLSQTVRRGGNATFSVTATGAGLTYQWFHDGLPIANATTATLLRNNVQPPDLGQYTVTVSNNVGRSALSLPATLEIGLFPNARTADKPQDLLAPPGGGSVSLAQLQPAAVLSGFAPVTAGTTGAQLFENVDATTSAGEPLTCGTIGGSSRWFALHAENDGVMVVDTISSSFGTVLTVYTGPTNYTDEFYLLIQQVACDENTAPSGSSQVCFEAKNGVDYLVSVDGIGGTQGTVNLNYRLHAMSDVLATSTNVLVRTGGDIGLTAGAHGLIAPIYQWMRNGDKLLGGTNSIFVLCNAQINQGGDYSVLVRNAADSLDRPIARLTVAQWTPGRITSGGAPQLHINGLASGGIIIDASTNLIDWTFWGTVNSPYNPFSLDSAIPPGQTNLLLRMRPIP